MVPTKSSKPATALYLALNDTVIEYGQQEAEWFMYQVVVAPPASTKSLDGCGRMLLVGLMLRK